MAKEQPDLLASAIAAAIAVLTALFLAILGPERAIADDSQNPIVRYLIGILGSNVILGFTYFSYLFAKGRIKNWYRSDLDDLDDARLCVYSGIVFLPFLICIPIVCFEAQASFAVHMIWVLLYGSQAVRMARAIGVIRNAR